MDQRYYNDSSGGSRQSIALILSSPIMWSPHPDGLTLLELFGEVAFPHA